MKIGEVVECALTYLGDEGGAITKVGMTDRKIALLVKCVNLAQKQCASVYLPAVDTCRVTARGGAFAYGQLQQRVSEIVSVKDENGSDVKFRARCADCEVASDGTLTVTYRYLPPDGGLEDNCALPPSVAAQTLALGACAEYCLIEGMYEQSALFRQRFADDMQNAARPKRMPTMARRRWA